MSKGKSFTAVRRPARKSPRDRLRAGARPKPARKSGGAAKPHSPAARSEGVLNGSGDAFMILDSGWRFTYLNAAAVRLLGKPAAELLGKKQWSEFAVAGGSLAKLCRRAMVERVPVEIGQAWAKDDHWYSATAFPVPGGELAVCLHDITERRRADDKAAALRRALEIQVTDLRQVLADVARAREVAEQASRTKDDFLAALSHELRAPLNPILLLASEAAENPELREEVREDFRTIVKNVALEARLINNLMDQMRITNGKLVLEKRPLDLRTILQDAAGAVRGDLEQKRVALALDFSAGQHTVHGDAARLQQVFANVLQNALKFTAEDGKIALVTSDGAEKGLVAIRVSGGGVALTPEESMRIMGAFAPGPPTGTPGARRFGGLSLALARTLVELHTGRIRAVGGEAGQTPAFVIELPLALDGLMAELPPPPAPTEPPPLKRPDPSAQRLRILLVEDHEATRLALGQMLVRRKYRVATAGSAAEALALAERKEFDLVVSDIGLPDTDGYQLMAALRELHGLKGIAITGYGMQQDIARSKMAGFVAHLIKPISAQTLENALNAASA